MILVRFMIISCIYDEPSKWGNVLFYGKIYQKEIKKIGAEIKIIPGLKERCHIYTNIKKKKEKRVSS